MCHIAKINPDSTEAENLVHSSQTSCLGAFQIYFNSLLQSHGSPPGWRISEWESG